MDIQECAHSLHDRLPDTQSLRDRRGLAVTRAGIRGLRLPGTITDVDGSSHHSVCEFDLGVRVAASQRGTHMSRLVQCAHELAPRIRTADLESELKQVVKRLEARGGTLGIRFPWFVEKTAPASGHRSLLDVEAAYEIQLDPWERRPSRRMLLQIPVTTLCPCSKAISRYGAHNQRSTVSVALRSHGAIGINDVVTLVEREASCPVYAVLKREDERYVTETAYENAKFAEDLVRDVHAALSRALHVTELRVETVNHESIHNHAAYALISEPTAKP